MWYSVVDPRSPGYKNKVVASFTTREEALNFADWCERDEGYIYPFLTMQTPTKPSIGEAINPDDLTEDERW